MGKKRSAAAEGDGRKIAPRGHFVVYVGSEMTRFVVPLSLLKNPLFQQLLDRAAEEYGFDHHNTTTTTTTTGITLPCDEPTFRRLIDAILSK
ncbi:UNVERIFIED_CONTAM: Auxin-responsive protein SAUR50 [Sesamum indicum]